MAELLLKDGARHPECMPDGRSQAMRKLRHDKAISNSRIDCDSTVDAAK